MKQVIHLIRQAEVEKKYVKILYLELDYELASLFDAIQQKNRGEEIRSKGRLKEIHEELTLLNGFEGE